MAALPPSQTGEGLTILPFDDVGMETLSIKRTMPKVLCCICGISMDPNPANKCVNCLRTEVDITDGIPKSILLYQCRGCSRYLRPGWVACELESRELLAVCLKKVTGLSRVKLVDAGFIWTEPHSRRLRIKLTIQKEVLNGVKLQQVFGIEFVLQNQQCDACQRSYTAHTWKASVQVRQKVEHKKTFFLLEQLILKHGAHDKCINIENVPNGVDFQFADKSHGLKFIDFLASVTPLRSKAAKQLVSEDVQNGVMKYKFSYAVELVPVCKDDLVVLPSRLAATLGAISPLVLVGRVTANITVLDPQTLQVEDASAEKYFRDPFRHLLTSARLEEFTVLDITPVTIAPVTGAALRRKQGSRASRTTGAGSTAGSVASGRSSGGAGGGGRVSTDKRDAIAVKERPSDPRLLDLSGAPTSFAPAAGGFGAGDKRRRGGGADDDDRASTFGASSAVGGSRRSAGGFTGGVSLAGGGVQFQGGGASSVASTVTGGLKGKSLLADAEVMRTRDMGISDARFVVRTHLGNVLRPGDCVMGYDLSAGVWNDADAESHATGGKGRTAGTAGRGGRVSWPEVVLVRKVYKKRLGRDDVADPAEEAPRTTIPGGRRARLAAAAATAAAVADDDMGSGAAAAGGKPAPDADAAGSAAAAPARKRAPRVWKLKRLAELVPTGGDGGNSGAGRRAADAAAREAADFESFLQDIETDPALRRSINLYQDKAALEARQARRAAAKAAAAAAAELAALATDPLRAEGGAAAAATAGEPLAVGVAAAAAPARRVAFDAAATAAAGEEDDDDDDESVGIPGVRVSDLLDDMAALAVGGGGGGGPAAAAAAGAGRSGEEGEDSEGAAAAAGGSAAGAVLDPEDAAVLAALARVGGGGGEGLAGGRAAAGFEYPRPGRAAFGTGIPEEGGEEDDDEL